MIVVYLIYEGPASDMVMINARKMVTTKRTELDAMMIQLV